MYLLSIIHLAISIFPDSIAKSKISATHSGPVDSGPFDGRRIS
jgi:hypothetical protein